MTDAAAVPEDAPYGTCKQCGAPLPKPNRRGRPRVLCYTCRPSVSVVYGHCKRCGEPLNWDSPSHHRRVFCSDTCRFAAHYAELNDRRENPNAPITWTASNGGTTEARKDLEETPAKYVPPPGAPWTTPRPHNNQNVVLELLSQGKTVKEAAKAVGVTPRAISHWNANNVVFRERFDWAVTAGENKVGGRVSDFIAFRKKYFGYDTFPHMRRMIDTIQYAKDDSITLILASPEAGKTSLITDLICWELARDPNYRICVISEGQDLARKIVRHVAKRMTDRTMFGDFIDRYGPFKYAPKKEHRATERESRQLWNADQLVVLKARSDQKDPSLEARGAGSRIYGSRYDLIILDDMQSTQNLNGSAGLFEYIRQDVLTRISEDPVTKRRGKTVIVGSRVGKGDLYELMQEAESDGAYFLDKEVNIPAVSDGNSYWPEQWPMDVLERRRKKVGEETWARVYLQRPYSSASATFTDEAIETALDHKRCIGERKGTDTVLGIDPALGGWCAITDVGWDAEHLYVLDQEAKRGLARTEDILNFIANHAQRYRPTVVVVEKNAMQKGLANDERLRALGDSYGFRVVAHETNRNKKDPVLGVASMAGSFGRRVNGLAEISLPYGDQRSREAMQPFIEELRAWRPDVATRHLKQDRIMSIWFTYLYWLEARQVVDMNAWRGRALPWRPSSRLAIPKGR